MEESRYNEITAAVMAGKSIRSACNSEYERKTYYLYKKRKKKESETRGRKKKGKKAEAKNYDYVPVERIRAELMKGCLNAAADPRWAKVALAVLEKLDPAFMTNTVTYTPSEYKEMLSDFLGSGEEEKKAEKKDDPPPLKVAI